MKKVESFFKGFRRGDKKWDQVINQHIWNISGPNNYYFLEMESQLWASGKVYWKWLYWHQPWKMDKVRTWNRVGNCISGKLKGINSKKVHREVWDLSLGLSVGWRTGVKEYTIEMKVRVMSWKTLNGSLRRLVFILMMVGTLGSWSHWAQRGGEWEQKALEPLSPSLPTLLPLPTVSYCNKSSGMVAEAQRRWALIWKRQRKLLETLLERWGSTFPALTPFSEMRRLRLLNVVFCWWH